MGDKISALIGERRTHILKLVWNAVAAIVVAFTILLVYRSYLPLPFADQWTLAPGYELRGWKLFAMPFESFGVHAIAAPQIIFLLDYWLTSWSQIPSEVAAFLSQVALAGAFFLLIKRLMLSYAFYAFVVILLFWAYQFPSFFSAIAIQIDLIYSATLWAFVVLSLRRDKGTVAALILALIATMTIANGVLCTVLLVPLALCLGLSKRSIMQIAAGAAVILVIYAVSVTYHPLKIFELSNLSLSEEYKIVASGGAHLVASLAYFGVLIGGPFGRLFFHAQDMNAAALMGAGVIGYAMFALFCWCLYRLYRAKGARQPALVLVLVFAGIFTLGSMAMIAYGRALKFPLYGAAAGRYTTEVMIFWLSSTLLCEYVLREAPFPRLARLPAIGACLLGLVVAASQPFIVKAMISSPGVTPQIVNSAKQYYYPGRLADRKASETALLSGVMDEAALNSIYMLPDNFHRFRVVVSVLREHHIAPFHRLWSNWLGSRPPVTIKKQADCSGTFDAVAPVPGGGWSVAGHFGTKGSNYILFLSDDGTVVGYGVRSPGKTLLQATLDSNPLWQGHVSPKAKGNVSAYLFDPGRSDLCYIASASSAVH